MTLPLRIIGRQCSVIVALPLGIIGRQCSVIVGPLLVSLVGNVLLLWLFLLVSLVGNVLLLWLFFLVSLVGNVLLLWLFLDISYNILYYRSSLFDCLLLQLCRCVLSLFVPHLFFCPCLRKPVLCECGLSWVTSFIHCTYYDICEQQRPRLTRCESVSCL